MLDPTGALRLLAAVIASLSWSVPVPAAAPAPVPRTEAADRYLRLIETFSGWAEDRWNEKEGCWDAQGSGVTWARGPDLPQHGRCP